jgi:hypothetical protein
MNYRINGNHFLKGQQFSFRTLAIKNLLVNALVLEPLNIFLYTWRFLATLERKESNKTVKTVYRWFSRMSIILVPLAYYGIYAALEVEITNYNLD